MGDRSSRQPSLRNSTVLEPLDRNVFSDDHAVDDSSSEFDVPVQDGFRPAGRASARLSHGGDSDYAECRTPQPPSPSPSTPGPSDSKQNPFEPSGPPAKGRVGEIRAHATGSSYAPSLHRSTSSASSFATATTGPLPAGPSHPYGMYPQGTGVVRTSSVISSSTVRSPQRAYSHRNRPGHPYTMYNPSMYDGQRDESHIQQTIPVGFPGHAQETHRQIGPDGEELDIIGIDGHTEQLPPYSRYPEGEDPFKDPPAPTPRQLAASPSDAEDSQNTLIDMPDVRAHRIESNESDSPSATLIGSSDGSHKEMNEKSWVEKSKKRVCFGKIPLWLAALLLVAFILLLGATLGGVLGTVVTKNLEHGGPPPHYTPPSTETFYDWASVTTQTDMRPYPTGTFAVTLEFPSETGHGCLVNSEQFNAWTCIVGGPPALLQMNYSPDETGGPSWDVIFTAWPDNETYYGASLPLFKVPTLKLVQDLGDPSRGPALHFQAMYDKKVIIPYSALQVDPADPSSSSERKARIKRDSWATTQERVKPGDKPWICFWNDTWVEGFIYQQNSTYSDYSSMASYITTTSTVPEPTSEPMVPTTGARYGLHNGRMRYPSRTTAPPVAPTAVQNHGDGSEVEAGEVIEILTDDKRRNDMPINLMPRMDTLHTKSFPIDVQPFPRALKLEESRYPDPDNFAYCERHDYYWNGRFEPTGEQVRLHEQTPGEPDDDADDEEAIYKRALAWLYQNQAEGPDYNCRCQWGDT